MDYNIGASAPFSKWDEIMDIIDRMTTEDVLDKCEVVSLDEIKNKGYIGGRKIC